MSTEQSTLASFLSKNTIICIPRQRQLAGNATHVLVLTGPGLRRPHLAASTSPGALFHRNHFPGLRPEMIVDFTGP
jgi:hypothetical protein